MVFRIVTTCNKSKQHADGYCASRSITYHLRVFESNECVLDTQRSYRIITSWPRSLFDHCGMGVWFQRMKYYTKYGYISYLRKMQNSSNQFCQWKDSLILNQRQPSAIIIVVSSWQRNTIQNTDHTNWITNGFLNMPP